MYYLDWFDEKHGNYVDTMISFKDENGKVFSTLETFFVTEDIWEGLKDYFKRYFNQSK